jgi:hypothetical protein
VRLYNFASRSSLLLHCAMANQTHPGSWLRQHGLSLIFLLVYVLMSLLVVEQSRTIESQRQLIRALFQDSLELTHMKTHQMAARQP